MNNQAFANADHRDAAILRAAYGPAAVPIVDPSDEDYTWTEQAPPVGLCYDLHTSGEHLAELTAQVDALKRAHEELAAQMRRLSEELAALRAVR